MKVIVIRSRAIDAAANRLAGVLADAGHQVELLVWDRRGHLSLSRTGNYRVRAFRLGAPYDTSWAVLFLPLWWAYETVHLLTTQCDVIHACDLDTLYPAVLAKLARRTKLCYTIYDFYASNLMGRRFPSILKRIRSMVAAVEKFGLRFTDVLFLADESRTREIDGARVQRVIFVYNSPEDEFPGTHPDHPQTSGRLHVFYAGLLLDSDRGLSHIVQAVRGLPGIQLTFAGTGPDERFLRKVSAQTKAVEFLGWISSHDDVIHRELAADALFRFSDPAIPKTLYESPNKLFDAMMCGKPIIVSDGGAMAKIVREEACGLVIPYGDVPAIREALVTLRDNLDLRLRLGQNGRRAYESKYSGAMMRERVEQAYRELNPPEGRAIRG